MTVASNRITWILAAAAALASAPAFPAASGPLTVELVVRDKKGAPVTDLKSEEVEITENGAKQTFADFRAATADGASLVVFLFPRLSRTDGALAQASAEDFLKKH